MNDSSEVGWENSPAGTLGADPRRPIGPPVFPFFILEDVPVFRMPVFLTFVVFFTPTLWVVPAPIDAMMDGYDVGYVVWDEKEYEL